MIYPSFPTNKIPFTLVIGIKTNSPQQIKFLAKDSKKPMTYYVNHKGVAKGYREFELKFPQVPENLSVAVFNTANGNFPDASDTSFRITRFEAIPLKKNPIWFSKEEDSFIKFARRFCEDASILSATTIKNGKKVPSVYRSDDNIFSINYYDVIQDKNGKIINTPARVGHHSGTIDVSKEAFLRYTVPMRMIILLHEFSHKWENPKNGRKINYETGADIAALYMYLSLGYSEIEAHQAFLTVFKGANNEGNHKRYKIIRDFIDKYNKGQLPTKGIGSTDITKKQFAVKN